MRERWDMNIPLLQWVARNLRRTRKHTDAELCETVRQDLRRLRGTYLSKADTTFARQHFKNWKWRI